MVFLSAKLVIDSFRECGVLTQCETSIFASYLDINVSTSTSAGKFPIKLMYSGDLEDACPDFSRLKRNFNHPF